MIKWSGSVHDVQVYTNSDFFFNGMKYIKSKNYILGDSIYPISSFLISFFKNPINSK
jgi:hypothetical protein